MGGNGEKVDYLSVLLTDQKALKREAVRRRKPYDEMNISPTDFQQYEVGGWAADKSRKTKAKLKIKKPKDLDERLENRFWSILFRMGYPEMNAGRSFTILIQRKGAEPLRKQIDVFAKDDETVIVAECKACNKVTKRSLQKDLEEFANLKGPVSAAIRLHYGESFKPKIIWLFVTENVIWSAPDKERAVGEKIRVITERELRYYAQIAEHLGRAARYQFLAEFLKDQQIPELAGKVVPAIRGQLGGKRFYCFVTRPRDLLKIAFVNHRSLNDPEGAPTYQRLVSKSRLRDIGKYLSAGGFFPTNILINFTREVRFEKVSTDIIGDVTHGRLYLPDRYRSAWMIDGQHRLYGFSSLQDKFLDQNIIVVAFERLAKQEEANLFVTINHEQKSVPKTLLDDLEGELKWGSTIPSERVGAIAARLINLLNADVGEPFHNRVTQQGITSTNKTCLTIPAIKDALRRSGLLGRAVLNNSNYELGPLCGSTDHETLEKARCAINQYFSVVRNTKLDQWELGREGFLCTNVAIQAHLLLFASLIRYMEADTAQSAKELSAPDILLAVEDYLQPVLELLTNGNNEKLAGIFEKVPFGSGGPPEYYYRLCAICKSRFADFSPEGMEDWESEQSEENITTADKRLKEIVVAIQKYIFDKLRETHGETNDAYWHKGITDKSIKADAYKRSLDEDDDARLPLENYLDVIDYKKIVENKQNWPIFLDVFNIPEPGEKGHAKNLKWLDRINELRRIPGHPSEKRVYRSEDFVYIEFVHAELFGRIAASKSGGLSASSEAISAADGAEGAHG